MTKRVAIVLCLCCLVVTPAAAQSPAPAAAAPPAQPEYPIVRIGVLSYVQYDAELENRDGYNVFDLTRGYININGQLAQNVRFRVTPDIRRASSDSSLSGSLLFRV